ncbi:C40 family peptidase [Streptomyces sp. B3I8]|uniref:C40 family peptidase n=1 Tax=Streptomyces sp. B3I8 TaxID=3042303 RepID=UPI002780DCDD|nr:C40 family peptidase [Streptomyces sp. B3I8]MDQ0789153.1 cell wall-associated NlpC family hydrolase [Streptomyces sp. B3I8]
MSGRLLRLVCTVAVTASVVLAPTRAAADPAPDERPLSELLTDLSQQYRGAERATEAYNATAGKLARQRAEWARLDARLATARRSLDDGRGTAGRLARQQYQGVSGISPYVRLLLARDPQTMLDEGHVIGRLARERAEAVTRLSGGARRADALAHAARRALDRQRSLTEQRRKDRDTVRAKLAGVERLLASLSPERLAELTRLEQERTAAAQNELLASGTMGDDDRPPSPAAGSALRYAVDQIGKPYRWGAAGPASYDCSGLTSRAWRAAGRSIPRTSQDQWARLPHVPLNALRPGDLVLYHPDATHVAMYAGHGMVVQAPRPGATVTLTPLATAPVLGAVRPDTAV